MDKPPLASSEARAPLNLWSTPRPPRPPQRRVSFHETEQEKTAANRWIEPQPDAYPDQANPDRACSPTSRAARLLSGNWDIRSMSPRYLKRVLLNKLANVTEHQTDLPTGPLQVERTILQVQMNSPSSSSDRKPLRQSEQLLAPAPLVELRPASTSRGSGVWVRLDELEMKHALGHGESCMPRSSPNAKVCKALFLPSFSGSAGSAFLATYKGNEVAVKVANSDRGSVESWRTELAALTQLRHPNLICCLACVEAPLSFGLVLEYCDGGGLVRLRSRAWRAFVRPAATARLHYTVPPWPELYGDLALGRVAKGRGGASVPAS